jgi:hypothetical protein
LSQRAGWLILLLAVLIGFGILAYVALSGE